MKAKNGDPIVCKCGSQCGSFRKDVADGAPITGEDFCISTPIQVDTNMHLCANCQAQVAVWVTEGHWKIISAGRWLE